MASGRFRWTTLLVAAGASVFAAATAYTVPRYSARYGQDCNLCHTNPTGGGQRSTYATQFIVPKELALLSLDDEALAAIDPQLSQSVSVGADLRTFFFRSDLSEEDRANLHTAPTENFFEMQGNVYLTLQLTDRFFAHLAQGISSTAELYGLGYILPANGYVKVGRFTPDFGWRVADHTAFTRDYMGLFPPSHTDVGLEAGVYPGPLAITASVMNGQLGSTRDFDKNVALTGRVLVRGNLGGGGVGFGGSVRQNEDPDAKRLAGGPLAYIHWNRITWLGEGDLAEVDQGQSDPPLAVFTSHELTFRLQQGLDLRGTFDYYDPDLDDGGSRLRYGFGAESMLYPFVRLEAMMFLHQNQGPEGAFPEPEYNQFEAQVHFCY